MMLINNIIQWREEVLEPKSFKRSLFLRGFEIVLLLVICIYFNAFDSVIMLPGIGKLELWMVVILGSFLITIISGKVLAFWRTKKYEKEHKSHFIKLFNEPFDNDLSKTTPINTSNFILHKKFPGFVFIFPIIILIVSFSIVLVQYSADYSPYKNVENTSRLNNSLMQHSLPEKISREAKERNFEEQNKNQTRMSQSLQNKQLSRVKKRLQRDRLGRVYEPDEEVYHLIDSDLINSKCKGGFQKLEQQSLFLISTSCKSLPDTKTSYRFQVEGQQAVLRGRLFYDGEEPVIGIMDSLFLGGDFFEQINPEDEINLILNEGDYTLVINNSSDDIIYILGQLYLDPIKD